MVWACHTAVMRVLSDVGGRMVQRVRRAGTSRVRVQDATERETRERLRAQVSELPAHLRHAHMRVNRYELDDLLNGVWRSFEAAFPDQAPCLVEVLDAYVRELLVAGTPHCMDRLRVALDKEPCFV